MSEQNTQEDDMEDRATIESLLMDEDHRSVHVILKGDGWGQGFGGLAFKDAAERGEWLRSLATVFGCSVDALVGRECVAHRAFGLIDSIEGLTSIDTGRTFTITAWRKRHGYPAPTPLEARLARREREIRHLKRRLAEEIASYDDIVARYTPIDGEAP